MYLSESWYEHCVVRESSDEQHQQTRERARGIPTIEFDCAAASVKTTDPERKVTILAAANKIHSDMLCTTICSQARSDEFVLQAFMHNITSLDFQNP